jgi:antitoxin HicB
MDVPVRRFTVILDPDPERGGYTATVPEIQGCITEGDTIEEALENVKEAILLCLEEMHDEGRDIPEDDLLVENVFVDV